MLVRTNELDCTVHGFRSSFKTWAIDATTTSWAVGAAALAHIVGNSTEAAYVQGDPHQGRGASSQPSRDSQAPFKTGALLPAPHSTRHV